MPTQNLSYSSLKAVIHSLPIEKRSKLSKTVVSIRSLNKLVPYRINQLSAEGDIFDRTFEFDTLKWKFRNLREIGKERVILPSGESIPLKNADISKFLEFYLNRGGTIVMNFNLTNFDGKLIFPGMIPRVETLKVFLNKRVEPDIFNQFSHFDRIPDVHFFNRTIANSRVIESLKNISVEKLTMITYPAENDDIILDLRPLKSMDCHEIRMTLERFEILCEKLKQELRTGSIYSGDILMEEAQKFEDVWKSLRVELGAQQKQNKCCMCIPCLPTVNGKQQLVVSWEKKKGGQRYRMTVRVMDSVKK